MAFKSARQRMAVMAKLKTRIKNETTVVFGKECTPAWLVVKTGTKKNVLDESFVTKARAVQAKKDMDVGALDRRLRERGIQRI